MVGLGAQGERIPAGFCALLFRLKDLAIQGGQAHYNGAFNFS